MFKMSELESLSNYLEIEVKQSPEKIELGQSSYAKKLLERAGMGTCNPCVVPMENRLKLSKNNNSLSIDATLFRSLIGSLRYVIHTRPNLSFGVGYLSRFMEEPKQEHMATMKHLLRYVASTLEFGLFYMSNNAD
jgi:hypothetical protein